MANYPLLIQKQLIPSGNPTNKPLFLVRLKSLLAKNITVHMIADDLRNRINNNEYVYFMYKDSIVEKISAEDLNVKILNDDIVQIIIASG